MRKAWLVIGVGLLAAGAFGQVAPDATLLAEIEKIKAVDNHTHVSKVVGAGEQDRDFDALPCDVIEAGADTLMTRPENPQFLEGWKKLYGYKYDDRDPAHVKELVAAREKVMREQGDHFPAWVLDQLHIQYMFANRVAMGRGLDAPRFRWVPFDDALIFPLNNDALAADTPDRKFFFSRENMLLERYRRELGVAPMPATFAEYTSRVVTPELERQKQEGAVA